MEKNIFFESDTLKHYLQNYATNLNEALQSLDSHAIMSAYSKIQHTADYGGTIFVAGNGGSAAISEHLMCDFMKGSGLRVVSLCSNLPLLTALANDFEYADIFAAKLKMLKASPRDCLMLISSSGNSPNIVKAAEYACEISLPVIGLSGFSGGRLRELSDVSLHIHAHNYGVVEDAHSAIMHCLAQWHSSKGNPE